VSSILLSLLFMVIVMRYMRAGPIAAGTVGARSFGAYRLLTVVYSVVGFVGGIVAFLLFAKANLMPVP
jgi:hypothetical protein